MPGVDTKALLESHYRNIEALTRATEVATEGAAAVYRRQQEIMQAAGEQVSAMVRDIKLGTEQQAEVAKKVVGEKLAACANILPALRSIYRWQGKIQDENEVLVLLKTRRQQFERQTALLLNVDGRLVAKARPIHSLLTTNRAPCDAYVVGVACMKKFAVTAVALIALLGLTGCAGIGKGKGKAPPPLPPPPVMTKG